MLPGFFVDPDGSDAVQEWGSFLKAQPDEAADALATLDWLGDTGPTSIQDEDRNRMGMSDLYCRQAAGWGVFYTVFGVRAVSRRLAGRPAHQFAPQCIGGVAAPLVLLWRHVGHVGPALPPNGDDRRPPARPASAS